MSKGFMLVQRICLVVVFSHATVLLPLQVWGNPAPIPPVADILDAASQTAKGIEPDELKVRILTEIGIAQAKAGEQTEATATLRSVARLVETISGDNRHVISENSFLTSQTWQIPWKIRAYIDVASAQAEADDNTAEGTTLQKALRASDAIKNGKDRVAALSDIAAVQLRAEGRLAAEGTLRRALHVAGSLEGTKYHKACALLTIALAYDRIDDKVFARATILRVIEITETMPVDDSKALLMQDVAAIQVAIGDKDGALATIQKVFRTIETFQENRSTLPLYYKVVTLVKVADAQVKAGDINAGLEKVRQAMKITDSIRDETLRSAALRDITIIQARIGNVEEAFRAENAIMDDSYKTAALPHIANAQIEAGDLEGAFQTANIVGMSDPLRRNAILGRIAVIRAKAGDIDGAQDVVDVIPDTGVIFKGPVVREIAAGRVKAGGVKHAYDWALRRPSPLEKSYALLGVAEGWRNATERNELM